VNPGHPAWRIPPAGPVLLPGDVHVWRAWLDTPGVPVSNLWESLSVRERERAERFRSPEHRSRFVAMHGVLRAILGAYLRLSPGDLQFTYSALGKPEVENTLGLRFSASRSQNIGLFAITLARAIGVDVEQVRPIEDAERIATAFFHPAEYEELMRTPEPVRLEMFCALWTKKEAYVKALGTGLSLPLESFSVVGPPPEQWSLYELAPYAGYAGAVAFEGRRAGSLDLYESSHIAMQKDRLAPLG